MEKYKGHHWGSWEVGDIVYKVYSPSQVYRVTGIRRDGDFFTDVLEVIDSKGVPNLLPARSAHDYRALYHDHLRKATNMAAVIAKLEV